MASEVDCKQNGATCCKKT